MTQQIASTESVVAHCMYLFLNWKNKCLFPKNDFSQSNQEGGRMRKGGNKHHPDSEHEPASLVPDPHIKVS